MSSGESAPAFGAGRFEVRGTLGAGGAGTVYRVFDRQLQREVALKLLRSASGRDLYRFKREFRALADITHPNLIALHELQATGGDWFFTMELIEGVSFIDWVRPPHGTGGPGRTRPDIAASPVNSARLRGALIQLVDAVIALHRAGKLHRDLKPSNVLVTSQGRLALLDFGLVAGMAEGDPEKLAVGTPVYMSPEQAADQPLGEASDWYSVGCMLYEALTGRRPFEGESEQVMTRKQTETPSHPTQLVPTVPADLARLCMSLLVPTSSARPTGMAILTQLGAAPSSTTRSMTRSMPPPNFVGRTSETEMLQRALADARRRGVTVLVKGRSGIGKSTLVRRFLRSLGESVFALEGRCFEREAVPFKMLDGVVDTLTAAIMSLPAAEVEALVPREVASLTRLFPVMRRIPAFTEPAGSIVPPDPQELRRRGFQALRSVLTMLTRLRPVAIFVDDAHWGDSDSCVFLAELIHGSDPGVLILVAHRPEDYLGMMARLRRPAGGSTRSGDLRDLEITPLPEADAILLVQQLAADTSRAATVVAAAAGNPLALTEMARAPSLAAGTKMDDLVRMRVSKLSMDVQAMLAVSAIAARPLPVEIAAQAAGVVGGHDEATILSAERLATLRRVGGQMILHPAHDYVRSAVLARIDTETKASWHEALARAFEAVQAPEQFDSLAVVEHWLAAGHPANAAHHAVTAAQRAEEALAFRRAAELYQIAITYGPWDVAGQRELMSRRAHALLCDGQLDDAAELYGLAAQLLTDDQAIDLERLRVESLLRRGRLEEGLPAAEKLLQQLGIRIPLTSRASRTKLATQWMQMKLRGLDFVPRDVAAIPAAKLLAADVLYSISSGLAFADPALGRVVQSELLRVALDAGEPVRVCLALAQEVSYAAAAGSRNRAAVEAVGARVRAVAAKLGHAHVIGFAETAIGIASHMSGRWRDARDQLEAGLAALRDHGAGVRWEIDIGDTYWLATLLHLGDWREMTRMAQNLLRDANERGDVIGQQLLRSGRSNMAWLLLGKPDEARAQLDLAERTLGDGFHLPHVHVLIAAANIDLYCGDAAGAMRRLDKAAPHLERLGISRVQQARIEIDVLRARVLLADGRGDRSGRVREARTIADDLIKEGAAWATGVGHLLLASCELAAGSEQSAQAQLAIAEDLLTACDMAGLLHIARLYRGRLDGGPGGAARAEAARDFLRDLGAIDPDAIAALLVPWPDDGRSRLY